LSKTVLRDVCDFKGLAELGYELGNLPSAFSLERRVGDEG